MPVDPYTQSIDELLGAPNPKANPVLSEFAKQRMDEEASVVYTPGFKLPYATYDQIADKNDVYDPTDFKTVGQRIRDNVVLALNNRFPISDEKYTLKLENIAYEKPKKTGLADEKDALMHEKSLNDRLKGDWVLYDNATGKELQRVNKTLINVPRMTERGTFIRNGSEIAMKHMFRLLPGVYTRVKNNGVIAAHINPAQGTGRQMAIELDDKTGVMHVARGTRMYGLLPILKAAGVPEETIRKSWGDELYDINAAKYDRIMRDGTKTFQEYQDLWDKDIKPILLDKDTTEATLGMPYEKMEPETLLRASNKMLKIARESGISDTDDRDSLQYQKVMGPADYIAERIIRDGGHLVKNMFKQISREGKLDGIQPGVFQPQVDSVFLSDKHAGYIDGSSPIEAYDFNSGISRLGEGGIGDTRAAPEESRGVQDSYAGYVDAVRSVESARVGLDVYMAYGAMKDGDGRLYSRMRTPDGTVDYVDMRTAAKSIVATPEFYDPKASPNEFIPAFYKGKGIEYVERKDVDYYIASSNNMMSAGAGMIPLIGGIRSNRTLMGCLHPDTELIVLRDHTPCIVTADELLHSHTNTDELITLDGLSESKAIAIRGVHKVQVDGHKLYKVSVADKTVVVSDNHKWLVADGTTAAPVLKETTTLGTNDYIPMTITHGSSYDRMVHWSAITAVEELEIDCDYIVDIDVDDNVYMLANGMFTHNSKYANQAVSLPQRQAPLVRRKITLADGSESTTEAMMGKTLGAKFSPVDGVVTAVDNDSIKIKGSDGRTVEIDLYNNFPANQKGWLSNYPSVKPGDKVFKNQCVAPSNYTDEQGVAALGTNLRVAFLNGKNAGTFEDAITISEEAAQLLASEQMYKMRAETTPDMEYSKTKYLTLFRTDDVTKDQLDKIGDDGVALEGVTLQKGDPIYLGVRMKDPGAHGVARKAYAPYIQTWEHDTPGEVVAVTRGKDHIQVYTKTYTPMEVGDKMCFAEGTELFTRRGWIDFRDLQYDDEVYTIDYKNGDAYFTEFSSAYSFQHTGLMYHLKSDKLDILVTDNHNHLVMHTNSIDRASLKTSEEIFGHTVYHLVCDDVTKESSYVCSKEHNAKEAWEKYNGRVYCVEVPQTHTVYVRYKGKAWFSGNSNRYGAKGVVSQIIPTDKMPRDAQGRPFHVLQSPLGLSSRINTSQLVDVQLGKVASVTGQPIALPDFMNESVIDYTQNLLKQHGLSETEDVYDPETGKTIPGIETGVMFTYKLKHMAESKQGGRSTGEYTMEELPMKGGDAGCFVWNTLVWTDKGPWPIGDICDKKDTFMKAVSYDSDTDDWVYCDIVDHFKYTTDTLVNIKTHTDNSSITAYVQATPNHVVYTWENERVLAGELQPGTVLRSWVYEGTTPVSQKVYVDSVVELKLDEPVNVYDIEVADSHNYTVGVGTARFLVSNSRRFGSLEVGALLAGGGDELMRDAKLIRGQENNEFWRVFRDGGTPDIPRWPLVHKKFFAHLKAAGINLEDRGDRIHMYGATDSDIKKLTHTRKVTEPATFDSKNFHPIEGGMFDPKIFGDQGDQWGYYELSEPVLNPLMFKPVANALGWKVTELDELLAGKREINGKFGTDALKHALESIDIDKELRTAKDTLKSKSSTLDAKNKAIKRIHALEPMKREGKRPEEFLLTRIPILPPVFRAVAQMSNKVNIAADVNFLYKRMMEADKDLKEAKGILPEDALMDARGALYRAVDAAIGVAPTDDPKLEAKQIGGVLKWAFGKGSPKLGSTHRKIFGASVDLGGRGTVVPDNSLDMDQVGLPEPTAWKMYEPFVMRKLRQRGYTMMDSIKMVMNKTDEAKRLLKEAMGERPILMNRAPTLWQYGIRGFYPVLTEGNAVRVNPNICKPYNMDFDGDSVRNSVRIAFSSEFPKTILDFSQNEAILSVDNNQGKESTMLNKEARVAYMNVRCAICDIPRIEDTRIEKDNGRITEWDVPQGVYTEAIDKETGKRTVAQITKLSQHRDVDMYDVTMSTAGAYEHVVTCSEENSLIAYKDGKLALIKASESLGAVIPRTAAFGFESHPSLCTKYIDIDGQVPLSYDLGLFLGMMIGDGWVDSNWSTYIAAECKEIQDEVLRLLNSENSVIKTNKSAHVYEYSTVDRLGGSIAHKIWCGIPRSTAGALKAKIGDGAYNKRIPLESMAASKAHRIGLLVGLIATDGTVHYNEKAAKGKNTAQKSIQFHTTSQYLRDNIIDLCLSLGIRATATSYMGANSKVPCYLVNLSVRDAVKLYHEDNRFRMLAETDSDAFDKMVMSVDADSDKADSFDPVPYPSHIKILLNRACKGIIPATEFSRYLKNGYISRTIARKLVAALKEYNYEWYTENGAGAKNDRPGYTSEQVKAFAEDWIRVVEDTSIGWEIVTDVKHLGLMESWDVTAEGPYTFTLGTGTFVQDSVALHTPTSDQAVRAVKERMMPSRSILSPKDLKAHYLPVAEFTQGLYLGTRSPKGQPIKFRSVQEMMEAVKTGKIAWDQAVDIPNE